MGACARPVPYRLRVVGRGRFWLLGKGRGNRQVSVGGSLGKRPLKRVVVAGLQAGLVQKSRNYSPSDSATALVVCASSAFPCGRFNLYNIMVSTLKKRNGKSNPAHDTKMLYSLAPSVKLNDSESPTPPHNCCHRYPVIILLLLLLFFIYFII